MPSDLMDRQESSPFLESLLRAKNAPALSFHMPGHKFSSTLNPLLTEYVGEEAYRADLTEMRPGVDYLHAAKEELLQAQQLAAQACGAKRSFFLVNGSTVGNIVSVMATAQDGQKVIVPRASHRSIYGGLMLSGATPVYVPPLYHPEVNFPLAVPVETVASLLREHPDAKAVQITAPNYYGYLSDVGGLAELAHQHGIPLLVDEAHGAHLAFHPMLPRSAVQLGADLVVQSSHKTLGALTQSALLHLNGDRVNEAQVERLLSVLQSSSPSALLMASLDGARQQMATKGEALLSRALELAHEARERIRHIPGLWCYGEELVGQPGIFAHDPTKLVIRVSETGQNGPTFARRLADEHHIHVEFVDPIQLICSITVADDAARVQQLLKGLEAVATSGTTGTTHRLTTMEPPALPRMAMNPRQANFAPSRRVPLKEAAGEICAEQIMPYPPGIPLVVPGEIIERDMIEYLGFIQAQGIKIVGPEDSGLKFIRIISPSG